MRQRHSEHFVADKERKQELEDRNHPVTRACLHCGNVEAKLMPPLGDYCEYNCPCCGVYRVSGTMKKLIELKQVDPTSAHLENQNGHRFLVK